jgi:hypothetical protein
VPAGELVSANSLLGVNTNLGRLVGGPLGGALLALGDLEVVVVADALTFAAAALLVARVRAAAKTRVPAAVPAAEPVVPVTGAAPAHGRSRRPGRAGWPGLPGRPFRAILAVAATAAVAQGLFVVLFVPFVIRSLHGAASEVGLLRAACSATVSASVRC